MDQTPQPILAKQGPSSLGGHVKPHMLPHFSETSGIGPNMSKLLLQKNRDLNTFNNFQNHFAEPLVHARVTPPSMVAVRPIPRFASRASAQHSWQSRSTQASTASRLEAEKAGLKLSPQGNEGGWDRTSNGSRMIQGSEHSLLPDVSHPFSEIPGSSGAILWFLFHDDSPG